ncbi:hypothetical protein VPH5P1C_0159 [Vibrio phage 5P1c]
MIIDNHKEILIHITNMCWLFVNSQRSVILDANASNNSDKASIYKG